jgi:hypothetical protein
MTTIPDAPSGTRRWILLAVIAAVLLIAAGGYWFFSMGSGDGVTSPPGSEVISFSGDGDQTTESFEVRQGWQIQWQHDRKFAMAIRGDRDFGTVIDEKGKAGSGVTSPVGAGTFYLEITANGPWQVTIIQGE